ncbi:hypothetical protein M413DRAFT_449588 [Hebeloma cylindrosporum]|uniref:Uncharacterized protein n=1 Tax=Hebeloma cylindrosporum TaxID=76867 RepID=A0A0C3BGK1_HEBCY|nr:hypothetical protein M413DRAFT_449588 [Hebeloma cylindrosporum h7]
MRRYTAAPSSSPPPVHIGEFAHWDEERLLTYFMKQAGKSRQETIQEFKRLYGGVEQFMEFSRKEKAAYEEAMGSGNALFVGVSSRHRVSVAITSCKESVAARL